MGTVAKSFGEITKTDEGTVLVVDSMNLAFRWKHAKAEYYKEEFYETVMSLANSYKCSRVIITADQRGSWFRSKLLPEYKENRKEARKDQSQKEKDEFEAFITEYEEALKFMETQGLLVLRYEKTEADDIAAYLVQILPDSKIWLVSTDRDWDLLLSDKVHRWAYTTRKEFTLDNWYTEQQDSRGGVHHKDFITLKCLMGDKGDNIPGIPQVGPKRAAGLIAQFGDVFDIYDSCPLPGHYKYIQNVNAHVDILLMNHELMDLVTFCEDALGPEACEDISTKTMEYMK